MPFPNQASDILGELQDKANLAVSRFRPLVFSKNTKPYERECQRRAAREALQEFCDYAIDTINRIEG